MHPEVYIFYSALAIMVVFLGYKLAVIAQYDRRNKNSIHFNPRAHLEHHVTRHVYRVLYVTHDKLVRPLVFVVVKNTTYIVRGARRSMNDLRYGRKRLGDVIEKKTVASGYIQDVVDQKNQMRKNSEDQL